MNAQRSISPWLAACLILTAVTLVYGAGLSHPFVWTDHAEIEQRALVPTTAAELVRMLTMPKGTAKPTVRAALQDEKRSANRYAYYRPVKALSYGLDYLTGGGEPWSFHLTNLLLHASCCLLLFSLIRHVVGERLPFFAAGLAMLHAVNPLHVEAVAWISARSDILVACFTLAAAQLLLWARRSPYAHLLRLGSSMAVVLAIGSKETGLMSAPLLIVVSLCFDDPNRARRWRRVVAECWMPALALLAVVVVRLAVIGDVRLGSLGAKASLGLWTTLDLFGRNLLMSFVPLGTTVADTVEVLDAPSLLSVTGPLFWLAWWLLGVRLVRSEPLVLFCALGWLLFVLPVSQLVPLLHPRADRYLYLPAAFTETVIALGLARLALRSAAPAVTRWLLAVTATLSLTTLATISNLTQSDWRDERALFARALGRQLNCIECWNNLAYAEALAGRYAQAAAACRAALAIDRHRYRGARDGFSLRWILANALLRMHRGKEAIVPLQLLVIRSGPSPPTLHLLAEAYLQAGRPAHALAVVEQALAAKPGDDGLRHLGQLAVRMERAVGFRWLFEHPVGCWQDEMR